MRVEAITALMNEGAEQDGAEHVLRRLEWTVIRRLDGLLQGDYRSLFYGYGVDFADLREYQPGDDIRYIDWNVTARMGAPYVKKYVEERDLTLLLLVDVSGSQSFGSRFLLKRDYAAAGVQHLLFAPDRGDPGRGGIDAWVRDMEHVATSVL